MFAHLVSWVHLPLLEQDCLQSLAHALTAPTPLQHRSTRMTSSASLALTLVPSIPQLATCRSTGKLSPLRNTVPYEPLTHSQTRMHTNQTLPRHNRRHHLVQHRHTICPATRSRMAHMAKRSTSTLARLQSAQVPLSPANSIHNHYGPLSVRALDRIYTATRRRSSRQRHPDTDSA